LRHPEEGEVGVTPTFFARQPATLFVARVRGGLKSLSMALVAVLLHVAPMPAAAAESALNLKSSAALILDEQTGEVLYGKNAGAILPIASITKLMTAMVVLDANLDPDEHLTVTNDDVDFLRGSTSRLAVGVSLSRDEMLRLALMASENRAASALSRHYPGGRNAFVQTMNLKAQLLGLYGTRFADGTGLSSTNVSTAEDLARLVRAAHRYPKISEYSTASNLSLTVGKRPMDFRNTNALVANRDWDIGLSKTGFINEAGRCLVMQAMLAGRGVVIVLLDSWGKYTRTADAVRVRQWLEVAAGIVAPPSRSNATQGKSPRASATKAAKTTKASRPQAKATRNSARKTPVKSTRSAATRSSNKVTVGAAARKPSS